ncbi:DNA-binding protein BIN4 [Porphyridium purpureum]|uniref:DNA-binding protein BIN4 n=1 Tax=Porphyridium purpureum TaxID=35688 RepID=A0A5J4YK52_PORPP|nr:DNA-binding protein BIN4 [Porphyridium purpureum]|eukprot:POR6775..scf297_16
MAATRPVWNPSFLDVDADSNAGGWSSSASSPPAASGSPDKDDRLATPEWVYKATPPPLACTRGDLEDENSLEEDLDAVARGAGKPDDGACESRGSPLRAKQQDRKRKAHNNVASGSKPGALESQNEASCTAGTFILSTSKAIDRTVAFVCSEEADTAEYTAFDLSGDMGAIGRVKRDADSQELFLDIKGVLYRAHSMLTNTMLVVTVGDNEAKVTAMGDEVAVLKAERHHLDQQLMVSGNVDFDDSDTNADENVAKRAQPGVGSAQNVAVDRILPKVSSSAVKPKKTKRKSSAASASKSANSNPKPKRAKLSSLEI